MFQHASCTWRLLCDGFITWLNVMLSDLVRTTRGLLIAFRWVKLNVISLLHSQIWKASTAQTFCQNLCGAWPPISSSSPAQHLISSAPIKTVRYVKSFSFRIVYAIVKLSFVACFCLAIIGRPEFKIEVSKDQRKTTLYVEDIQTAVLNAQKQPLTIQDIFKNDLQYKVTYSKARSSGKVRDD